MMKSELMIVLTIATTFRIYPLLFLALFFFNDFLIAGDYGLDYFRIYDFNYLLMGYVMFTETYI